MIKVTINNICAKLVECEPLTSGMIGKTLDVELSADWAGLSKTAVFSNGDKTIDVMESEWNGNTIGIPWEVLETPNRAVSFGIYGYTMSGDDIILAIPTLYTSLGRVYLGTNPSGDESTDPSLPVYAQLQWQIDHFEISDEQIAQQIQEYLAEHPIEIQPATASVLGGVKVGDGLSVTADGTLSADAPDLSEYAKTEDVDELANIVDGKQDEIADLDEIRAGAELGATALQSVPSTYALKTDLPTKTSDLTNDSDFTTKTYVDNAIDTVQQDVDDIEAVISTQATPTNKLVSASEMGDAISAVEAKQLYATSFQGSFATKAQLLSATTFYNADGTVATPTKNDIAYVLADESHSGKSAKYVIADITSSGIVWGFVITFSDTTFSQTQMDAINSGVTQQKVGAYDSHIANKSNPHEVTYQQLGGTNPSYTKGETDTLLAGKQPTILDLATIRSGAALGATAVQPESGKGLFSGDYNDLTNKPTIPSAVTESTVSGWGFTKNTGTYSKPSTGIPKTDLASAVQTSLGKADSALQSVPNTYALKTDLPTKTSDLTNDAGYLTLATLPIYDGSVI